MFGPQYQQDVLGWMSESRVQVAPSVEEVRPARCQHCAASARESDGRVVLEGHGVRMRPVVVVNFDAGPMFRRTSCWARRYWCNRCERSTLVLPPGVRSGCLYSVAAVVVAWLGTAMLRVAQGTAQPAVCAPEGVDRDDEVRAPRWRSPYRWAARLRASWPWHVLVGRSWRERVDGLLLTLSCRASSRDARAIALWGTATHATHGALV